MAFVVALTGGIGSGKSAVSDILKSLGAAVIDSDQISHELTAPGGAGAAAIRDHFGPEFLRADGALDRERMRQLVFADPAARKRLEAILHPMIRDAVAHRVQGLSADPSVPYIVLAVPLLIETGAYKEIYRRILVVDCDEDQQVARVMKRSGLAPAAVRAIMANQAGREIRLSHADDVVRNDAGLDELRQRVEDLHHRYLAMAAGGKASTGA